MYSRIMVLLCAVCTLFSAMAFAGQDDPVLGKVGDYVVKKSDIDRVLSYYTPDNQKYFRENPEQLVQLVERMLQVKVISDLAKEKKFHQREEIKRQTDYLVDEFLSKEYLNRVVGKDVSVTEEELKQYYALNKQDFGLPEQVRARHILIRLVPGSSAQKKEKAKKKAAVLLEQLKQGEDFEKLARNYSEDPGSRNKGGDLGYFTRGGALKPLEDVAFGLEPGQVSDVVETQYGFHIIKVEDYHKARPRTFEEARELIRQQVQQEVRTLEMKHFVEEAALAAGTEVYSDRILGKKQF